MRMFLFHIHALISEAANTGTVATTDQSIKSTQYISSQAIKRGNSFKTDE